MDRTAHSMARDPNTMKGRGLAMVFWNTRWKRFLILDIPYLQSCAQRGFKGFKISPVPFKVDFIIK